MEFDELYGTPLDAPAAKLETAKFEGRVLGGAAATAGRSEGKTASPRSGGRTPRGVSDGLNWSKDAARLAELLRLEAVTLPTGATSKYAKRSFLYGFFTELRMPNLGLKELDRGLLRLKNLKELTLSGNQIEVISNVPRALASLNVYCNAVRAVATRKVVNSMINLGVGYNFLIDAEDIVTSFPNLVILDACYNR